MNKRIVVADKHVPLPFVPIFPTITLWLLLDRLSAPGWVWGAVGMIVAFLWVTYIVDFFTRETRTPVWKEDL